MKELLSWDLLPIWVAVAGYLVFLFIMWGFFAAASGHYPWPPPSKPKDPDEPDPALDYAYAQDEDYGVPENHTLFVSQGVPDVVDIPPAPGHE